MADPALGPGGPGGFGFPGIGGLFPGFGGNFGLDVNGGLGGGPWGGGFGGFAPYIPVTPLGALGGFKGDLLIPIVVIGVAVFLLLIIVLAVKAALAWKLEFLEDLAGNKRVRSVADVPAAHDTEQMNDLATIVLSALESQRCLEKIICQVGAYGRGTSWPTYFSMIESFVPEDYKQSLSLLKSSAEGLTTCDRFQCGQDKAKDNKPSSPIDNKNSTLPITQANQSQQQKEATGANSQSQEPQKNVNQGVPSNQL